MSSHVKHPLIIEVRSMTPNTKKPARSSRAKILEAASELAREVGPGNLSLDAVAARAGLSKGGLLYNFPSKAKLMEALVELHVSQYRDAIGEAQSGHSNAANSLARAIIDVFRQECGAREAPKTGLLAAIAENPAFIDPVRAHQRELVGRLKAESEDPEMAALVFLVVEGMRCMHLFEIDAFSRQEAASILQRLAELMETQSKLRAGV